MEAFQREPAPAFRPKAFCKLAVDTAGQPIAEIDWHEGSLALWRDGGVRVPAFTGLPDAVWSFAVSGYRVLPRWLEARKGLAFDDAMKNQIRDIAARIHELIHWFGEADLALDATLADTLTRTELGFAADPAPAADDEDE